MITAEKMGKATQKDVALIEVARVNAQMDDNSRWGLSCSVPQGIEVGVAAVILNLFIKDIVTSAWFAYAGAFLIKGYSLHNDMQKLSQKREDLLQNLENLNKPS